MIKAIWSFKDSNKGDIPRTDLVLPLFSVIMWKQLYPQHTTTLYVDPHFKSKFQDAGILGYWDDVIDVLNDTSVEVNERFYPSQSILADVLAKDDEQGIDIEITAEEVEGSEKKSQLNSDINMALYIATYILPMLYSSFITNPTDNDDFEGTSELLWKLYADNPFIIYKDTPTAYVSDEAIPSSKEIQKEVHTTLSKITNLFKKKQNV